MAEVVLPGRLRAAIKKLNPGISPNALDIAIQELTKDRITLSPARANQAVYQLLKNGVKVAAHPAFAEAAVLAVAHPTLGEDVAAAIVLREGAVATALELRRFAATRLAPFKVPRRI